MLGVLAGGWAYVLRGDASIAIAVSLAMLSAAIVATSAGAALPIIFRAFGLDPALMSGPFITTIVDLTTVVIYFEIGRRLLQP
jgi:magnesium transporter